MISRGCLIYRMDYRVSRNGLALYSTLPCGGGVGGMDELYEILALGSGGEEWST